MKRILFFCLVSLFLATGSEAWGITGLGIGVRGGILRNYSDDNLDKIPTRDGDWLKDMPMMGAHLSIGTLRIIHLEAAVEYAWKKKEIVMEDLIKTEFSVKDLSLNATAKYVFSSPVLKPYLGAGMGWHRLAYEISNEAFSAFIPADQNKFGYHGVGGILVSFPAFPLDLMFEARYTSIQTENEPTKYTSFLGGVTYKLP
jgi:opacity protein-like surface antigen